MIDKLKNRIAVSKGDKKADLILKNAKIVNVFSGEVNHGNIAVVDGVIAGIGDYNNGDEIVDCQGKYVLPGLIDAHIHIESSHLIPSCFAQAVLEKGTTAVIADPHEIANVLGVEGLEFMIKDAKLSPMDIFYMLPSAVPSTDKETAGAIINGDAVGDLLAKYPEFIGLGEVINAPGVIFGDDDVLKKLAFAQEKLIDGHYPMGSGNLLSAYCSAGISSDHECTTSAEAEEKLKNGLMILMREGSSAKNLEALLPVVNDYNWHNFCFCADDISALDIQLRGDILNCLKKAVKLGLNPVRGVQIATINPARHYGLKARGAIAPGYIADFLVVDNLRDFTVDKVYKNGKQYVEHGEYKPRKIGKVTLPSLKNIKFPLIGNHKYARVIKAFPADLITEEIIYTAEEVANNHNIAKLMVVERHGKNGNIGFGLVEGFDLKAGCIATTIAHDSHNLLALGIDDEEMIFAAQALGKQGGGAIITKNKKVLAALPLPIAGLMTWEDAKTVAKKEEEFLKAKSELGISMDSPLMTLSFLALPVIPKLKLTDMGLFNGEDFDFVPLYFD
ncbi:MAG: adenine deaminase [Clostridiales bacterium]